MKLAKISTIVKKNRLQYPERYKDFRDECLEKIVKSDPKMNIHVTISNKPF